MINNGYGLSSRPYVEEQASPTPSGGESMTTVVEVNVGADRPSGTPEDSSASVRLDVGAVLDGVNGQAKPGEAGSEAVLIDLAGANGNAPDTVVVDLGDDKGSSSPDSTFVVVETGGAGGDTPAVVIDASQPARGDAPEVIVIDMTGHSGKPGESDAPVHATVVDPGGADAATSAALTAALAAQTGGDAAPADEVMAGVLEAVDAMPSGSRDEGAPVVIVLTDGKEPPPSVTVVEGRDELSPQHQSMLLHARDLRPGELRISRMLTSAYLAKYVYTVAYPPAVATPPPPPTIRLLKRLRLKGGRDLPAAHVLGSSLHAHLSQKSSRQIIRRVASVGFSASGTVGGYSPPSASGGGSEAAEVSVG